MQVLPFGTSFRAIRCRHLREVDSPGEARRRQHPGDPLGGVTRGNGSKSREPGSRRAFRMATGARDPETIIREFFATWPERNVEKLLDYFTDDAVYHNMPMEPVTGKNGIREVLNLFIPA